MPVTLTRTCRLVVLLLLAANAVGCAEEEREVTTTSDEAYAAYEEATADLERFRLEEARARFAEAVALDPQFSMAWAHLGIVQRQLGQTEEADASIEKAWETRSTASEVESLWIDRLHALFARDTDRADEDYAKLLESYPDHPWVLRLRAEYAKQNNDFETALACYDRLLEKDPDAVAIHNLKGYLYLSQGDYENAVRSLQRYAYYAQDQANPHDSLGEAYLHIGRYEDAIGEFRTALEIDPTFVWSADNLAAALSITGQTRAAVKVLQVSRPVFEERRMIPWWDMSRTRIAVRAEHWNEVLDLTGDSLDRLGELEAHEKLEYELFTRWARSMALLETGQKEAAGEALNELARVADEVRNYGPVAKLQRPQQLMELNEAMTLARFDRSEGRPAEGIPRLQEAVDKAELSPYELSYPTYELAMAYLAADQPEAAAAAAQKILDAIPTAPKLNLVAAKALARTGNRDLALEHLQTYLDVMRNADADDAQVEEATALLQQLVPRS